jgi:hypothetical protein
MVWPTSNMIRGCFCENLSMMTASKPAAIDSGAVTLLNRKLGPAVVLERAERRAPWGFGHIEEVIPRPSWTVRRALPPTV